MNVILKTKHGNKEYKVYLQKKLYAFPLTKYKKRVICFTGSNIKTGEPFAKFSTYLPESDDIKENQFYAKTWEENEGFMEQLEKAGIIKILGKKVKTGFCEAVLCEIISEELLKQKVTG